MEKKLIGRTQKPSASRMYARAAGYANAPRIAIPESSGAIRKLNIKNKFLLEELRKIEPGEWKKVYKDGYSAGNEISIHYFESRAGKVFDLKVKLGWSNQ